MDRSDAEGIGVLIVEDEVLLTLNVRQTLQAEGYRVLGSTTSGTEAVELAGRLCPHVILMDIKLAGGASGIDAARLIKELRPSTHIIFVTGNTDEGTLRAAMSARPSGMIEKPYEDEELLMTIEHALDGRNLTIWE